MIVSNSPKFTVPLVYYTGMEWNILLLLDNLVCLVILSKKKCKITKNKLAQFYDDDKRVTVNFTASVIYYNMRSGVIFIV